MNIRVRINRSWAVDGHAAFPVPYSAEAVWRVMRYIPDFVTHDVFHRRLTVHGPLAAGTSITLRHRIAGFVFDRPGRMLKIVPGQSFTFSDTSARGLKRGYPHVLTYRVDPLNTCHCVVGIHVRGKWTARWLGKTAARLWNHGVLAAMAFTCARHLNHAVRDDLHPPTRAARPEGANHEPRALDLSVLRHDQHRVDRLGRAHVASQRAGVPGRSVR